MEEIWVLSVLIQYNAGEVRVVDAYQVQDRKEMERVLEEFCVETGYESVRSVNDWADEWEAHNTLWRLGLRTEQMKDCDLEESEAWWRRVGYKIIKIFKEVWEMLGDIFNVNKRKDVISREGQVMYRGHKYTREEGTGYMVCTTGGRKRLHDVMWLEERGRAMGFSKIPAGCVVHHLDWNKEHNEINNLVLVTRREHNLIHNPPTRLQGEDAEIVEELKEKGIIKK